MCGITGIYFKNPRDLGINQRKLENLVDELLLGIEHRGKDATGLLVVDAKGVPTLEKADTHATNFVAWRRPMTRRPRTILGHTRWATQGPPSNLDNDHPVTYGSCYAIHNGHINNDTELFTEHSLERHAEVDSEIIPALFDKYGLNNAKDALEQFEGNMATAVVDPARFPNQLVLAKGWTSPLFYWESKYALVFASTEEVIKDAAKRALGFTPASSALHKLDHGNLLLLNEDKIERQSFKPKSTVRKYPYSSTSTTDTNGTTYYNPSTGRSGTTKDNSRLYDKCKSCSCRRLWHGSAGNFSGACRNKIELETGGYWECRCDEFVQQENNTSLAFEFCDGCGREFPLGDLKKVGKNYFCPHVCALELFKVGPTEADMKEAAEAVVSKQISTADETDGDEFSYEAWEVRETEVAAQAIELVSEQTGLTPKFIDWLLNKAPISLFEADASDYLNQAHKIASDAYSVIEKQLNDAVFRLDMIRWNSGDSSPNVCELCGARTRFDETCESCGAEGEIESCGIVVELYPAEEEVG